MRFHRGDLVKWIGGSYHYLQGIVVDTRQSLPMDNGEVKVVWDVKGLGSLKQKAGGAWQRAACLEILSSVEQNDENR
jgi:hypothetical protein